MLNSVRVYNTTPRPIQYTCNIYTHYTKPLTNHVEQSESVQYYTKPLTNHVEQCESVQYYTKPLTNHVEQCESVQYYTKAYTIYM